MRIAEKLNAKQDIYNNPPVTIAFLGDSVTQGCFECFMDGEKIGTVYDVPSAFSTRVREILNMLYPGVQVNIINSGLSGGAASGGLRRLERDVLRYQPDLVVVSFGLNDCCNPNITLEDYIDAIRQIITRLNENHIETIFLTQNFMNRKVSCHIREDSLREGSALNMQMQQSGTLTRYMEAAAAVTEECGGRVCDLHGIWEKMASAGVDTDGLLANHINHPTRQMHVYMAIKLVETMLDIQD